MRKTVGEKGVTGILLFVFVVVNIIPAIAQEIQRASESTAKGSWLYVGGVGPGNYTWIQDASDNASPGDTVFVCHGVYDEHLLVEKALYLYGENCSSTIIDGGGVDRVVLLGAKVTMAGFTVQNGEVGIENKNIPLTSVWNLTGNIIRYNVEGIALGMTRNQVISRNIIRNNDVGITLFSTGGCLIHENNFIGNEKQSYFESLFFHLFLPRDNWNENYWDNSKGNLPKPIGGNLVIMFVLRPGSGQVTALCWWSSFDWHPAQEPFLIGESL
jgi:parallel beta-helix repeat protein